MKPRELILCCLLALLAWPIIATALLLEQLHGLISETSNQVSAISRALTGDAAQLTGSAQGTVDALSVAAIGEVNTARRDLTRQTSELIDASKLSIEQTNESLDRLTNSVADALAHISGIRQDVQPILENAAHVTAQLREDSDLLLDCQGNSQCLPNRIIGTNQAIEKTAQETQRTMRAIADGIPPILATAQRISDNSDATARATAQLMSNLAVQTHPLPTWMRVGLQIGVPVAGIAAGAATAYQSTH